MGYIMFCLGEMSDCRARSSNATLTEALQHTTSDKSRPLLKYVLADGFRHLGYLESDNAGILNDMESLQRLIIRYAWEWDRLCKLVPSVRSGIPWPGSRHDFTMYTLLGFASDTLFHTFLDHSDLAPREGTNPLVYAAQLGKIGHARALILRGANVNHQAFVVDKLAVTDSDTDTQESDADDPDVQTSNADSFMECKAPIEIAVDHWDAKMLDLFLGQGSSIPDRLLTRVLRVHPHQFPLYIIRRLLQTPQFVEWAVTSGDNRQLLEEIVEDEEDFEQDDLILATRRLVEVGHAESLLLVAVEKGCIPVVRAMNGSVGSDVSSLSPGGFSI